MSRCDELFIDEMAFHRDTWIDKVRDSILGGALGEYAKLYIARKFNKSDYWSNEVKVLLSQLDNYMNPKIIKSKSKFNRNKAFKEAYVEASTFQSQITDAKNELVKQDEFKGLYKDIRLLSITAPDLIKEMIAEYKPKLVKLTK